MSDLIAGFAAADITPPLGVAMAGYGARDKPAESLVDPLRAQALVLGSGDTFAAIICTDLIGLHDDVCIPVREQAATLCGIDPHAIMVCCSHTHWGPVVSGARYLAKYLLETVSEEYRLTLIKTLAGLVVEAKAAAVPVAAGCGAGFADRITFNRRQVGDDFKTEMHLTLDQPAALAASVEGNRLAQAWRRGEHKGPRLSAPLPEVSGKRVGPADGQVTVLRLQKTSGEPFAGLVNFACHAVCGGADFYGFSADFPGYARDAFSDLIGAPMLFAAGASGDQVPRWRQNDARQRVGKSMGAEAARVWLQTDEQRADVPLATAYEVANLPLSDRIIPVEQARAELAAKPDPEGTDAVYERCMLEIAEETESMTEGYPAEVWAMALGDLGIVGVPGEMLTEIALQIKQRSPFTHTMVVTLANGCIGYLPTDDAVAEGGYEPGWSPVGKGTEKVLVQTSLSLLHKLHG